MGRKEKEQLTVNDFGNPSSLLLTAFFFTTRGVERLFIKQPPVSSDSSAAITAPLAPLNWTVDSFNNEAEVVHIELSSFQYSGTIFRRPW